jgi:ABC-2 type transport system ATP-binding protein
LCVAKGEVFGFIGANGAGKSTTIKILTGAIRPTKGNVSIFGIPVGQANSRLGMGYVPENPSLPSYLTPLEILQGAMSLHQFKVHDRSAYCMKWLERLQIDHVASKPIRGFSKGMAQRTALAHALCIKPRLLILDEPLSGLDPIGRKDVVEILAEYKREGGTVFLTSHVLHDVERLADRFGLIHQGEMKTTRSPMELVDAEHKFMVRTSGTMGVSGMVAEGNERWVGEFNGAELWAKLRELEQVRHQLIEVRPTLSLEHVFMQYVQSASDIGSETSRVDGIDEH